ncbi:MAG: hypothetical protein M1825_002534 [Sarcosagium campestre]|nr:MAG: hypothetical protein M1825_002534 [Sarcosagium campestre]
MSSRATSSRNANTQPTYDFLGGSASPTPTQNSLRQSHAIRPASGGDSLRADLKALQYELDTLKQERELVSLRHEKELREVQKKAEFDFKRAQASESESHLATSKYETLAEEVKYTKEQASNDRAELEKKLRIEQEKSHDLQEELEEVGAERSSLERESKHRVNELETRCGTLQRTADELRQDLSEKATSLQHTQQRLSQRDQEIGNLESEVLRLKAHAGDVDTLNVIKRELSEQVAHIKKLEHMNREQAAEIKHYRKLHKSVEIVEEEKRSLEGKISRMDDLRRELSEAQLRKQVLEDERRSWTSYLEFQRPADGEWEFDSPEQLAKAYVRERLEKVALIERLGGIDAEISGKDEMLQSLEQDKARLHKEMDKLRFGSGGDSKAKNRLERQRALAVKEVEYLRAQLKIFDAEETTFQPDTFNEQKTKRIEELEALVDQYRKELKSLNDELVTRNESNSLSSSADSAGSKRPREDESEEHERLGELSRKNRKLQDEITKLQQQCKLLTTDLGATRTQLTSLQTASRTRILTLQSNPTHDLARANHARLSSLQTENAALLSQLQCLLHSSSSSNSHHNAVSGGGVGKSGGGSSLGSVVPLSSLENSQAETRDMALAVAEKEKRMLRLKQIWAAKSLEFREAVASVLGWKLDFLPNGRVRVTSMLDPELASSSNTEDGGKMKDLDGVTEERSIVFDGENGTMKISGGENSAFKREIRGLVRFWVEERKDIPCFLAAMTLEFYERSYSSADGGHGHGPGHGHGDGDAGTETETETDVDSRLDG